MTPPPPSPIPTAGRWRGSSGALGPVGRASGQVAEREHHRRRKEQRRRGAGLGPQIVAPEADLEVGRLDGRKDCGGCRGALRCDVGAHHFIKPLQLWASHTHNAHYVHVQPNAHHTRFDPSGICWCYERVVGGVILPGERRRDEGRRGEESWRERGEKQTPVARGSSSVCKKS